MLKFNLFEPTFVEIKYESDYSRCQQQKPKKTKSLPSRRSWGNRKKGSKQKFQNYVKNRFKIQ